MLNALEKVMYPNGKIKALGDITSGSVSSIIDEVHANTSAITSITAQLSALVDDVGTNTSAITSINTKLGHLTYDSETEKYNMSSGLNVQWHLVAQHHLRANDFDLGENNAGFRNSIYRGKNLGTSISAEQWDSIQAGTFDNMFIGDYWTINGVNWRIAGFDYWLGTGSTPLTDHHVVIVPDTTLDATSMNDTNVVTGGYFSSKMRGGNNYPSDGNINTSVVAVLDAFDDHVLTHSSFITNDSDAGVASGWVEKTSTVDLMSEVMVYGTPAWSMLGRGFEVGYECGQLPLFRHNKKHIAAERNYWLRSIYTNESFCAVNQYGNTSGYTANTTVGVRPAFAIYDPITQQNNTRKKASKKKGE